MRTRVALLLLTLMTSGCYASSSHQAVLARPSETQRDFSASHGFTEYPVPTQSAQPDAINVAPSQDVLFVERAANKIARLNPDKSFLEIPIPSATGEPIAIAGDDHGGIWFIDSANFIGAYDGAFTMYPIPTANSNPMGIASDGEVTIWFTEHDANKIGEIASDGSITEFAIPTPNTGPTAIVANLGDDVWFTQTTSNQIGHFSGGNFTEFNIPTPNSDPTSIVFDLEGNVWFNEANYARVGMINATTLTMSETNLPHAADKVQGLAKVNDGNVWGVTSPGNHVLEMTSFGQILSYRIPTPASGATSAFALDRNLYFTERTANKIGDFSVHKNIGPEVRLTGEAPYNDPVYGTVLGYFLTHNSQVSQVITVPAGADIIFFNKDPSLTHTVSFLGDATQNGAPWPPMFNGSSTQSPPYSWIGATNFSTGPIPPNGKSPPYETGFPGFYMIGCAYHYDSNGMRTIIIVR